MVESPLFSQLMDLVVEFGCQETFASRHQYLASSVIHERPSEASQFFDILASGLTSPNLGNVIVATAASLRGDRRNRGVLRVLKLAKKFATESTISWTILELVVKASQLNLSHPDVLREMKGMLEISTLDEAMLVGLGAGPDVVLSLGASSRSEQIADFIDVGAFDSLADIVNEWITAGRPLLDLSRKLRVYSHELAELNFADRVSDYRMYDTSTARLTFAAIIDDKAYLKMSLKSDIYGESGILARCKLGYWDWYENLVGESGKSMNIKTPAFLSGSLEDVFSSVISCKGVGKHYLEKLPLVTVIMTTFNPNLNLMKLAVDSVLRQEHVSVELVIIDDGSSSDFAADIRSLAQARDGVIFKRCEQNHGPYHCRNIAINLSKGEYIAIQDADDVSHPSRIRTQISALRDAGDKAMLSISHHLRVDAGGYPQFEENFRLFGDGTMTSVYRRVVFDLLGPFVSVRSRGDVEMNERIRSAYGESAIVRIPYPLMYCSASSRSLSHTTVRQSPQYLSLFRANFARQHRNFRQAVAIRGSVLAPNSAVPPALRP